MWLWRGGWGRVLSIPLTQFDDFCAAAGPRPEVFQEEGVLDLEFVDRGRGDVFVGSDLHDVHYRFHTGRWRLSLVYYSIDGRAVLY